jgi:Sugar phosphate permease
MEIKLKNSTSRQLLYVWLLIFSWVYLSAIQLFLVDWSLLYLSERASATMGFCSRSFGFLGLLLGFLVVGYGADKFPSKNYLKFVLLLQLGMISLPIFFWLMPASIVVNYHCYLAALGSFFTFGIQVAMCIAVVKLSSKHSLGRNLAAMIFMMYFCQLSVNAPIGIMIDKFGWNGFFVLLVSYSLTYWLLLYFTALDPERYSDT